MSGRLDGAEMACVELVALVTDYLDGVLPAGELARFEAHIAGCGSCTTYLEQFRAAIVVVGSLPPERLPSALREHLLGVFRQLAT